MPTNKSYSVIGSINNDIQTIYTNLTLDRAQARKSELESNGIGGTRDANGGYYGSIQNAITVNNVTVVEDRFNGDAATAQTDEVFSVTASASGAYGYFYFEPANTPESVDALTTTASGASESEYKLLRSGKIEVYNPSLTDTDSVSAVYTYASTDDIQDGSTVLGDGVEIDGSTFIFSLDHKYDSGSVTLENAVSGAYVVEGGANLVEIGVLDVNGDKSAYGTGNGDLTVNYQYCSGDQGDPPASDTFNEDLSQDGITPGTPRNPPF